MADASQLHQVLVNLVLNGSHAAGPGGWVRLEVLPDPEEPDGWTGFRVRDSGPGIAVELRDRLFDPFFTTKDAGEGTGLGLSVCYGIIQDHGGTIHLGNHPEGGAEAVVRLPPAPSGVAARDQEAPE
jgi:signal transduction histidine kinase